MVKRTNHLKYQNHNTANNVRRQFLSSKGDKHHIYHAADSIPQPNKDASMPQSVSKATQATKIAPVSEPESITKLDLTVQMPAVVTNQVSTTTEMVSVTATTTISNPNSPKSIPDVQVTATEIIKTIVGCSLKKNPNEIPLTGTIKGLAGGLYF